MARDVRAYLSDARDAVDAILEFTRDKSFDDYAQDRILHSAVERQFVIIGEALAQLSRLDAQLADQVPDLPRIIAFRNILVHGYAAVDHDQVWSAVETRLPGLRDALEKLIAKD